MEEVWKERIDGRTLDKEDNLPVPRIGIMCLLFPQEVFPLCSGGQELKKRDNYLDWIRRSNVSWMGFVNNNLSVAMISCPSTSTMWMVRRSASTAPPPDHQSIAALTDHFTTISTCVASTIFEKPATGFFLMFTFAQSCRSESWAKTDAGGWGERARVRVSGVPCSLVCRAQLLRHNHRGFPAVVEPRKPK